VSLHLSNARCGFGIDRKHLSHSSIVNAERIQGAAVETFPLTNHGCSAVKMIGSAVAGNLPEEMDGLLREYGMSSGSHLGEAG
jgi:hypothetical protein